MTTYAFRTTHQDATNVWVELPDARPDVLFEDCVSFVTLSPLTARGRAWLKWNCREAFAFNGAVAVEPRFVLDVLVGMREAGLEVVR